MSDLTTEAVTTAPELCSQSTVNSISVKQCAKRARKSTAHLGAALPFIFWLQLYLPDMLGTRGAIWALVWTTVVKSFVNKKRPTRSTIEYDSKI